jgi:hypothetical protein
VASTCPLFAVAAWYNQKPRKVRRFNRDFVRLHPFYREILMAQKN